ncbi:MAG: hypothetical protein H7Y60_18995 [Rhodospirillaceae bacterium]|nr:hypothetical protein [Rhodospirillales bacterium]
MSFIRYLGVPVAALILSTAIPSDSFAACTAVAGITPNDVNDANSLVEKSASKHLRRAHKAQRCKIVKALHEGGRLCGENESTWHVTVHELDMLNGVKLGSTYHVFNHKNSKNFWCTTQGE